MRYVPFLAALAALVGGCLPALPDMEAEPAPRFDVEAFFLGETAGLGTLWIRTRGAQTVRVSSVGTAQDGALRLRQSVRLGDAEPYERVWTFRPAGPGRYTGTLTEARGPISAQVTGNRLDIRYRTGRFTTVRQSLALQPGGRLALNHLRVSVLGVPVAKLEEQIRRVEGSVGP